MGSLASGVVRWVLPFLTGFSPLVSDRPSFIGRMSEALHLACGLLGEEGFSV